MIHRILSCPNKPQQLAVSEQFPLLRLQVHTLSHEIVGRTLGRIEEILPGCGFLRQNDLVAFFANKNLGTLETEFFWQPHCLASSRREQFCSFSHGAPYNSNDRYHDEYHEAGVISRCATPQGDTGRLEEIGCGSEGARKEYNSKILTTNLAGSEGWRFPKY
jgi:hypothetical protein